MMNSTSDEFSRQAPSSGLGRRPGDSGAREAIFRVARRQFAELGYDRTTMRGVAAEAGVDPALVSYFYGSKQRLFLTVVELPFEPGEVLPHLLAGDRAGVGLRLARFVLSLLESDEGRQRLTGLVRAATAEPDAARLLRELIARELFQPLVAGLGMNDAPTRAALVGAQIVGLLMARYVVAVEPLASLDAASVAAIYAPLFQRLLTEPLPSPSAP